MNSAKAGLIMQILLKLYDLYRLVKGKDVKPPLDPNGT